MLKSIAEKQILTLPGLPGGGRGAGRRGLLCPHDAEQDLVLISEVSWLISGTELCLKFNASILRKNTRCYSAAYFRVAFVQIFWEIVFPAVNPKLYTC